MTITLARGTTTDSRGVIGQLALFEGRRLLASPALWLATLASGALAWLAIQSTPSTLDLRSVAIAGACLPVAAVSLIMSHLAASRDRSSRVGDLATAPPSGRDQRMLGLAMAAWAPLLIALLVVILGVALSVSDDPAGSWNLAEMAVGPMVVLLGHTVGVALGRWAPHPLAAPLVLVVVAGLFVMDNFVFGPRVIPAASQFLPWRTPYTDWVQGEPRSPRLHLVYLLGLTGIAVTLASRRWRGLVVAGVVVAGAVIGLSGLEVGGEEVVAAVDKWDAAQPRVCEDHDGVEFCAIEGYEPWIDDWVHTIDRVRDVVPVGLILEDVHQTAGNPFADADPTVALVYGRWEGPQSTDARSLTDQVLAPQLGLPGTFGETAALDRGLPACMAGMFPLLVSGEARGVGLLVLTNLVIPGSEPGEGFGGTAQFGEIEVSEAEAQLAARILDLPETEILDALHGRWTTFVDPRTTSAELADWFGLEPPEVSTESSYEGMTCTCTGDRGVQCTGDGP